jgi:hypothetical protein
MSESQSPLWLHAYSGRENGLMVVGSAEALKTLGAQLQRAGDHVSKPSKDWPPEVARPLVAGPYKDVPDFQLTFHLVGDASLFTTTSHIRRNIPVPLFLVIAACAVVGAVTIFRWVVSYAI